MKKERITKGCCILPIIFKIEGGFTEMEIEVCWNRDTFRKEQHLESEIHG